MLVGCDIAGSKIRQRAPTGDTVAELRLQVPAHDVLERLVSGLSIESQRDSDFYLDHGFKSAIESGAPAILWPEEVRFTCDENGQGIYLEVPPGEAIVSQIYFTDSGPLPYVANFTVCVTRSIDSETTTVSVSSSNAVIYNGYEFNGHALAFVPIKHSVDPVREEELILLRYIAHLFSHDLPDSVMNGTNRIELDTPILEPVVVGRR